MFVNRTMLFSAALLCAASASAAPMIRPGSVRCSQDPATKLVTVTFTVGDELNQEPAIVTADFETNVTGAAEGPWVSIGGEHCRNLGGDVNRILEPGEHSFHWRPDQCWPNHVLDADRFRVTVQAWAKDDPPDYLVCLLDPPRSYRFYTSEAALPGGIESETYRRDKLVLRRIHAAGVTWRMGSPAGEKGRAGSIENVRAVTLSQDYYIGVFPFTLGQYCAVQGLNPSSRTREDILSPLVGWSWIHIRYNISGNSYPDTDPIPWPEDRSVASNSLMNSIRRATGGIECDFTTAAQWEYACRAGTTSARFDGSECPYDWSKRWDADEDAAMEDYAWYANNSGTHIHPVGAKKPNPWGLYDLYGNVYEMCLDLEDTAYPTTPVTDPVGGTTGVKFLMCGGAHSCGSPFLRSAARSTVHRRVGYEGEGEGAVLGFRLAAPAVIP